MLTTDTDTIAATATPSGRGGIGIVRVSGSQAAAVAQQLLGKIPTPRHAFYTDFKQADGQVIDQGIALYFPAPASFTGEDVLELQGHGGPVVLRLLLQAVLACGVRAAKPGEFSERAFLNDKIDLVQAEAIADLIDSSTEQAARCALRSLQGDFSQAIHELVDKLTHLRCYIEAGIDFPDEELDLLADGQVQAQLNALQQRQQQIQARAQQGHLLREGMNLVLIGAPNTGKSSLLNRLSGRETAIVTPIAGTTRDIIRDSIQLDGLPIHITDTAGLRDTDDPIEQEGIRRALTALKDADSVLLLCDDRDPQDPIPPPDIPAHCPVLILRNKCDLSAQPAGFDSKQQHLRLSIKQGQGIELLAQWLKQKMGYQQQTEGSFMARERHLQALAQSQIHINAAEQQAEAQQGELCAEELRLAQQVLAQITGTVSADDLLGKIFSSFCIGK